VLAFWSPLLDRQLRDDSERLSIALELTTEGSKQHVQLVLRNVTERRMPEIVREASGLHDVWVEFERSSKSLLLWLFVRKETFDKAPADLAHLQ
jgi:hypothetical protein